MYKVLVVGGAGFIGSHMVKFLHQAGVETVTLDNLSTGFRDAVKFGDFVHADLADRSSLDEVFSGKKFDAVMHFASSIQVGESVLNPAKYYRNNVVNTLNLLDSMRCHNVDRIIFSSTAAIFGNPDYTPIDEGHPKNPTNPYGHSKLMIEQILSDYDHAYGIKSICLRYFNAAGADPDGVLGERHDPETHLIPLALMAALDKSKIFCINGSDYPTKDGTCIRDYIHVSDLVQAHWLALTKLIEQGVSDKYNLGNGKGFSVQEVVDIVKDIECAHLTVEYKGRRPGDPTILVSDSSKIKRELDWAPKYSDINAIINHALQWLMGTKQ